MTDEPHPIHISPQALERVAALRLAGLPLATFLALLARLYSTGRAEIPQPEVGKVCPRAPARSGSHSRHSWLPGSSSRRRNGEEWGAAGRIAFHRP